MLTVVLTSEARLYRYLTCGGQSTKSFRQEVSSKEERFASKKLPSIEAQGRLDVWTEALGHIIPQKVNPVKLPTILFSQNIFVSFIHSLLYDLQQYSACRNMSSTLQTDLSKIFLRHEYLKQRSLLDCPGFQVPHPL